MPHSIHIYPAFSYIFWLAHMSMWYYRASDLSKVHSSVYNGCWLGPPTFSQRIDFTIATKTTHSSTPMYVRSTYWGPTCSMTCPELSHFRSVTICKIPHMQISHVSEDDGSFLDPLSARALVLKGLSRPGRCLFHFTFLSFIF